MFKPSIYQEAIFNHIKNSTQHAVIEAVAGSGKTTTLVESLKICGTSDVIFVAFNKHIADELVPKVPKGVKVTTMHSFGFSQIKRAYPKAVLNNDKARKIIIENISNLNMENVNDKFEYMNNLVSIIDLLRLNLCSDNESAKNIILKHSLEYRESILEDAFKIIKLMNQSRDIIDFVDMIYIPAIEDIRINEYSLVLVDECQDLSKCQIKLLSKMVNSNGRILAVGDRHQAIYGFGGADTESFDTLCNMDNTVLLPLSISYRCSKKVVERAQMIVPTIQYAENAIIGNVNMNGSLKSVNYGDFILCRTNAPLISLALKMISEGKKATVKGLDIGKKLLNNLKSTKTNKVEDAIDVLWERYFIAKDELDNSEFNMKSKLVLLNMEDMIQATIAISNGCRTFDEVSDKINKVFSDTKNSGITLSTVHKAKGLEADNVHIIKPQLLPLKNLTLSWEIEQEDNLHYVAITRAKENLYYIPDEKE